MIRTRLAAPADLPAVAAVHIESCRDIYRGLVPDEIVDGVMTDTLRRLWAEETLANGDFIVMAEQAGAALGLVTVRPAKYETPYIDHFHVRPRMKGQGVGRALWEATRAEMLRRNLASVWLDVAAGNDAALAFYRAIGGAPGEMVTGDLFGTPVPAQVIRWPRLDAD